MTSARDATRPRYQGRGVPKFAGSSRGSDPVRLDYDAATFLPDPMKRLDALWATFAAARGAHPREMYAALPAVRCRDGRAIASYVTLALRNDLLTFDRRDAAVLWEIWRRGAQHLRRALDGDPDALMIGNLSALELRLVEIVEAIRTALAEPGRLAREYCPWAGKFFTQDRLYPERS